jgi:hypothetical protein
MGMLLIAALACGGGGTTAPQGGGAGGGAQPIEQWAASATASSQYGDPDWAASAATGAPDTSECGDYATAWASESSSGQDWLEVTYSTAVVPTKIVIYETYNPGSIVKVEVKDTSGNYHTAWTGNAGAASECPRQLTVTVSGVSQKVNAVRINLDQSVVGSWDEIDAVQLVGTP